MCAPALHLQFLSGFPECLFSISVLERDRDKVFTCLLLQCFPMAYLMEQAGGLASTGSERVLDLQPADIHERCPIFMGSSNDVNQLLQLIQKYS